MDRDSNPLGIRKIVAQNYVSYLFGRSTDSFCTSCIQCSIRVKVMLAGIKTTCQQSNSCQHGEKSLRLRANTLWGHYSPGKSQTVERSNVLTCNMSQKDIDPWISL